MTLKITLRPNDKIIIAGALIRNTDRTANLLIENKVPVLRGKEILKKENATSPAQKIYFVVQLMYLDQANLADYQKLYWHLANAFIGAAPSSLGLIDKINGQILTAQYYKALKCARELIKYEQSLLSSTNAKNIKGTSLPI
ncbi:MAG: flagellar biosynthesis repressor FlbT [Smithellaceae bacterium]